MAEVDVSKAETDKEEDDITPQEQIGILQQVVPLISQQIVAIVLVCGYMYLVTIQQVSVPEGFKTIVDVVIGFYFGTKTAVSTIK